MKIFSLRNRTYRPAICMGCLVLLTTFANGYSVTHAWMVLTAYLVSQSSFGSPLSKGLQIICAVIFILIISVFIHWVLQYGSLVYFVGVFVFIGASGWFFYTRPHLSKDIFILNILLLIFIFTLMRPVPVLFSIKDSIIDICIGGVAALIFNGLFLFNRTEIYFRKGVGMILSGLILNAKDLENFFISSDSNYRRLLFDKIHIEEIFSSERYAYPEWVYEPGFNPGLREGFRFFLINLERIADFHFSLTYLILRSLEKNFSKEWNKDIATCIQNNKTLLTLLQIYFLDNCFKEIDIDLTSDLEKLDAVANKMMPTHLELLDVFSEDISLIAIAKNISDTRQTLLQLINALPPPETVK